MTALPPGARCGRHPESEARALCLRCGDFLCARCAVRTEAGAEGYCAACEPLAREPFVWERRGELGLARALWRTALGTLTRTRELFAPGFRDRSALPALAYGLAWSVPVILATTAAELTWPSEERLRLLEGPPGWMFSDEALLARAAAAPLTFALSVLVMASLWWIGFRLTGRATRPFSHLVRAVAYVQGSTAPLALVSLLPDIVDGPLQLVVALLTLVLEGRALGAVMQAPGRHVLAAGAVMVVIVGAIACVAGALFAFYLLPHVP